MSFLREIKRRKVFQVAAAYAVIAWLLVQIITAVEEPLSLPAWFDTAIIVLLAAGFPIAVILAWAFDVTPQGIVQTPTAARPDVSVDAQVPESPTQQRHEPLPNSVAVLPLQNLSLDAGDAFFAAGVHEAILNELAKIKDLHVMARTSVMRYADEQTPISRIAQDLKVQTVMEGSVQYANGRVRITAQLIDAATDAHLWSENYDRDFDDIFAIQTDIATRIATALQAELTQTEQRMLDRSPTQSPEAYALYLKAITLSAMHGGLEVTDEMSARFHGYLDEALALDPDFALAYASKAREYAYSIARPIRLPDELTVVVRDELARKNAQKALSLDGDCGVAYAALGVADRFARRDEEAERALKKALSLTPQDPRVLRDLYFFYYFRGRFEDAATLARKLVDVDPGFGSLLLAEAQWCSGDLDAGLTTIRKALDLLSNVHFVRWARGALLLLKGEHEGAVNEFKIAETLNIAATPMGIAQLAWGYGRLGRTDTALDLLAKLTEFAKEWTVDHGSWAMTQLAAGYHAEALASLRRAAADTMPGPEVSTGFLAYNILEDPVLERPEFVEARRALRLG